MTSATADNGFAAARCAVRWWLGREIADAQANFNARWVPEFDTKNRPEGNGISVNMTLAFF